MYLWSFIDENTMNVLKEIMHVASLYFCCKNSPPLSEWCSRCGVKLAGNWPISCHLLANTRQTVATHRLQDCLCRDTLMTGLLKIIIVFSSNQMPPSIPSQIRRIKQCSGIVWSKVQPSFETGFENVKIFNRRTQSS